LALARAVFVILSLFAPVSVMLNLFDRWSFHSRILILLLGVESKTLKQVQGDEWRGTGAGDWHVQGDEWRLTGPDHFGPAATTPLEM
jgi:hypothetical protein